MFLKKIVHVYNIIHHFADIFGFTISQSVYGLHLNTQPYLYLAHEPRGSCDENCLLVVKLGNRGVVIVTHYSLLFCTLL